MGNNDNNDILSDILDLISIWLNLKNLELNEQQINDLNNHLKMQDESLLGKIIEQNEELIRLNKRILRILKDRK